MRTFKDRFLVKLIQKTLFTKNIQRCYRWDQKITKQNLNYLLQIWDKFTINIILHGNNYRHKIIPKVAKKEKVWDDLLIDSKLIDFRQVIVNEWKPFFMST